MDQDRDYTSACSPTYTRDIRTHMHAHVCWMRAFPSSALRTLCQRALPAACTPASSAANCCDLCGGRHIAALAWLGTPACVWLLDACAHHGWVFTRTAVLLSWYCRWVVRCLAHARAAAGARPVPTPRCCVWPRWAERGGPAQRHHHVHVAAARQPGVQAPAQGEQQGSTGHQGSTT